MADCELAKALALADGKIDTKETEIIKKELMADGKLDRSEVEWLIDVRKNASGTVHVFDQFIFDSLKPIILADGDIDAKEANFLRKFLYADGKIDAGEKEFLKALKAGAKKTCPEFDELYKQAVGA